MTLYELVTKQFIIQRKMTTAVIEEWQRTDEEVASAVLELLKEENNV